MTRIVRAVSLYTLHTHKHLWQSTHWLNQELKYNGKNQRLSSAVRQFGDILLSFISTQCYHLNWSNQIFLFQLPRSRIIDNWTWVVLIIIFKYSRKQWFSGKLQGWYEICYSIAIVRCDNIVEPHISHILMPLYFYAINFQI